MRKVFGQVKATMYKILFPSILNIMSLFFDKKYLHGKYFSNTSMGVRWCFRGILWQKILKINAHVPWPVSPFILINSYENIQFDPDDLNNFQGIGNYFQNFAGKIIIGKGSYIAPNVGIITANHDFYNLDEHNGAKDVIIGKSCWIGMNSILLPGVILGDHTVVGAGSVVTKSFDKGYCVVAGNPAKIIKELEKSKFENDSKILST